MEGRVHSSCSLSKVRGSWAPPPNRGRGTTTPQVQNQASDRGTHGAERKIAYEALRAAGFTEAEAAEKAAAGLESAVDVVTLEEAMDTRAMYPSTTLVALRAPNLRLFQEALARSTQAVATTSVTSLTTSCFLVCAAL